MSSITAPAEKGFLGLSPALIWGYVAIALFMTGDGLEQAFLSDYLVTDLGYTTAQSGTLFTVYGLVVAVAAFASGVLAEYYGPRRVMVVATFGWIAFHAGFLLFGIMADNYAMMLVMYAIRAIAYPLFVYGFVVWISYAAPQSRLSSAMGWFWASYSIGVGVFGSYLPSLAIPFVGEVATMWAAIAFIAAGGLLAGFLVTGRGPRTDGPRSLAGLGRTLAHTVALPFRNPQLGLGMVQRIINQIALYGFVVMLPIVFVRDIGFEQSQWLQLWGLVYLVTVGTNLMWGILGDRIGWIRTVRWFGSIGMFLATLLLYFLPATFGPVPWIAGAGVVLFGIAIAAYVPLSALMPALEPEHRGGAVALLNLAAGASQFVGSLLVTLLWGVLGTEGTVVVLACTYLVGFALTFLMKVDQSALARHEAEQAASAAR
ncbi:MFS transporter [Microbacterium sp. NPDC055683]